MSVDYKRARPAPATGPAQDGASRMPSGLENSSAIDAMRGEAEAWEMGPIVQLMGGQSAGDKTGKPRPGGGTRPGGKRVGAAPTMPNAFA